MIYNNIIIFVTYLHCTYCVLFKLATCSAYNRYQRSLLFHFYKYNSEGPCILHPKINFVKRALIPYIDLIIRWGVKRNILWYTVTFFIIFHLKHGIFRPYNQINVPIRLPLQTNPSKLSQPFLRSFLGAIVAHTANVVPVGTPLAAPLLSQSPVSVWRLQSPRRLFFVHNSPVHFNYFGVRFHKKCLKNIINLH